MENENVSRLRRLRKRMLAGDLDALYVGARPNIRYLSDFTGSAGHLLVEHDQVTLFTDSRYTVQAGEQTSGVEVSVGKRDSFLDFLASLKERKIGALGYERNRLSLSAFEALQEARGRRKLLPQEQLVEELRVVKSEAEIDAIRRSVDLNSESLERVLGAVRPTWTENRTAGELDYWMRRLGAAGSSFETIVAAGAHSALPHATPRNERLGKNRLVLIDQGADLDGYASDMTRVVSFGDPGAEARKIHAAVLDALEAAVSTVRAGVSTRTVDQAARKSLEKKGLADRFTHSIGHGVGLEIHEPPFFRRGSDQALRLKAGMVITVEPGVYLPGIGGVRIEDILVVRAKGYERLTKTSPKLRIL